MAATALNQVEQTSVTDILSAELNALADNTLSSAGAAINNVYATANWNGYPYCSLQLLLAAYTGTPSAGAAILVWLLKSIDAGTTYEDSSSARPPDVIIPIGAVASGPQKITIKDVKIPVGNFKPIAKTSGVGLTLAATGNKLTALPNSYQGQ